MVVAIDGLHYHFCRYVDLVGGDLCRVGELLDGEQGLFLSGTCGFIAELVEVYEGFGYREDKEAGVVSRDGVRVRHGGMECEVSNLGYFR